MVEADLIKSLSKSIKEDIIQIRRQLHAHPELSFEEAETANYISSQLTAWNISHERGIGGHGISALIEGNNPSKKVIALRADMDALPINEKNDVPYKSQNTGVMHACGHDVHSASLLGTAKILNSLKNDFEGSVKMIFQPAEERLPGGASLMIRDGILENPKPDAIIAQHVFTQIPIGKAGFFAGKYMASSDELYITVTGKGGHAAVPADVINPLFIAARLLVALEDFSGALSIAAVPTILTFGKITGAGATNVIPDEVRIDGTFSTNGQRNRVNLNCFFNTVHCESRCCVPRPTAVAPAVMLPGM
jgi:amidohydrolase